MEVIRFIDDVGGDSFKHATHPFLDYTLCGITIDGDENYAGEWESMNGRINCPRCIEIINHCKRIKAKNVKK